MAEIAKWRRSGMYFRIYTDSDLSVIVKDNSDANKKVLFESGLTSIYNSALWIGNYGGTNRILLSLFATQAISISVQYSSDGQNWSSTGNRDFNSGNNGFYTYGSLSNYPNGVKYMVNIDEWETWDESYIKAFTDVDEYAAYIGNPQVNAITSNGGGATHIAKVTGQLSSLSNNLSDILMVSGGGGGGLLSGDTDYSGKEAGGISGSGDNSANQSTGYAFGQGESAVGVSGGGSGLYGGYKGTSSKSGGAGSGYIGNSLVSNKKMVGYNVPTSSAESTKTESVNEASESPVSGKPKIGNGFARIKFLREIQE